MINVSCIIPVFNDTHNLLNAVESCLMQGENTEVIIVDDCSTDTSFKVAQQIAATSGERVQALQNIKNSGPALTRNHGALHARGELLCFLDSDDQYLAGFTKLCAALLKQHPEWAVVKTLIDIVNPDGSRPLAKDDPRLKAAANSYPCNMLVRKEVFWAIGGFSTDVRHRGPLAGEDTAFYSAVVKLFHCVTIQQAFVVHNNRPGSHLETFLARTRVENGKIIFLHSDQALKEQEMTSASNDYFARAKRNLTSLKLCSK